MQRLMATARLMSVEVEVQGRGQSYEIRGTHVLYLSTEQNSSSVPTHAPIIGKYI
eukprot:SAG31_NODE_59_length_29571_cov_20.443506_7_plen_55_part_00